MSDEEVRSSMSLFVFNFYAIIKRPSIQMGSQRLACMGLQFFDAQRSQVRSQLSINIKARSNQIISHSSKEDRFMTCTG